MTDTSTPTINHLGLLEAVCSAKYPRQALPSIASNRSLRLDQVLAVLEQYGWPDMDRVRAGARQLLREHNDGTGPSPVSSVPAPPTPAAPSPASMPPRPRPAPPAPSTSPRREPSGPYVAALPASKLFADPSYQRDLDTRRVAKMVEAYDPALVGILEVSDRGDGRYAILDGQHRWAVSREHAFADDEHDAEVLPDPHLACQVHTGLDVTEEAVLYHRLNTTRKQLTGWDRWVARRRAGDQVVLDIEAAVQRCGYTIGTATAPGILRGTKSCEVVVEAGGIARLEVVLGVVRGAYGDDQTGLEGSIVQGIAHVVGAYDRAELDLARLVDALAGIVPRQLAARASAVREIHRGTIDRLVAHVIVERYNTLPGRKLEPFFVRVPPASKARDAAIERNSAIRAWAEAEGIEIPPRQIPQKVRDAYDAAHTAPAEATR